MAALCALAAAPAFAAAQQDLRSPDAREAALTQDLRSPDARDAGAGRLPGSVVVISAPGRQPVPVAQEFDWRAAWIGAGVAVGLVLIATSAALLLRRRRTVQVA
jgi:hypothetical protein